MLSPQERQDKIIRATDLDALSCRFNANKKRYFVPQDPYIDKILLSYDQHLAYSLGYTNLSAGRTLRSVFNEQKLPLINRGTYIRTKLIDMIVDEFIASQSEPQIISLGGGSDTRCFRILKEHPEVTYVELDFTDSVKIKKLAILNDDQLREIVGTSESHIEVDSRSKFNALDPDLHTSNYHLVGCDIRTLDPELASDHHYGKFIKKDKPTLVLSECVLCYLPPEDYKTALQFWDKMFAGGQQILSYLIYEPMSLNDAFGDTMTLNLTSRGINLHTFHQFSDLSTRLNFLKDTMNFNYLRLTDISDIGGYGPERSNPWLDLPELQRINRLELIDEVEEIKLLFEHYCLCYAESKATNTSNHFTNIDKWHWLKTE